MRMWMNLYRTGYYHRAGKPLTVEVHGGDLYPSREAALADIDPAAPYVETVELDSMGWYSVFPEGCNPVGLRETRAAYDSGVLPPKLTEAEWLVKQAPSHTIGMRPLALVPKDGEGYGPGEDRPLETGDEGGWDLHLFRHNAGVTVSRHPAARNTLVATQGAAEALL